MAKVIRQTYPIEVSIGVLILIFVISFFLSFEVINSPMQGLHRDLHAYMGMGLASLGVVIMALILWEEFLFPVKVKPEDGGMVYRNHKRKLLTQAFIYLSIPALFAFIYTNFEVNLTWFVAWSAICIITPIVGKLISGLHNYNDYLKLTDTSIEYKNNKLEGVYELEDIQAIEMIRDDRGVLHKIRLIHPPEEPLTIDLDEMELDDFLSQIDEHLTGHYGSKVTS